MDLLNTDFPPKFAYCLALPNLVPDPAATTIAQVFSTLNTVALFSVFSRTTIIFIVNHVETLKSTEMFSTLNRDQLEQLGELSTSLQLERNDQIFTEDDTATALFILLQGRIAITRNSVDERESVLALMEPGDLFGEMPFFDHGDRSAAARALEASTVLAVPYTALHMLYSQHPELLWRVVTLLSLRLRITDSALADAMFLDVPGRTAKRLLELPEDWTDSHYRLLKKSFLGWLERQGNALTKHSLPLLDWDGSNVQEIATTLFNETH